MNIYLTSTVKLNLVKFHSGTSTQTPRSAATCPASQLLVDTYTDKVCVNNMLTCD